MKRRLLSVATLALLAAGCAATQKEPPPKPFTGTRWQVKLELPIVGEQPNMRFGDGRVEGFSGCNAFTARYVQDSVGSRFIAMGRLEVGRRDCDQAARAAEARVLGVLQGVSSYTITVDTMIMSGSSGSLTFVALSSPQPATAGAPMTTGSLENTRWIGAMPAGGSAQTTPRLELGEGGKVAGFTGCNVLSGQWHEEGDAVVLTSIAVTKRFCVDAAGEAEKVFLAAVGEGSKVTRAGAGVVVTSPTGIKLSLTAAAAA